MRTNIAIATFLTVAAGAVGASALTGVTNFRGSDTLYDVTNSVMNACRTNFTDATYTYLGTGSGNGENAMNANPATQTIAPMSRFIKGGSATAAGCATTASGATPTTSEGLVLGLDGLSIVGAAVTAGSAACNGTDTDCNASTNTAAGLSYSKTITLADGVTTYTFNGWRDVLRIVYGGMDRNGGSALANRNCNSPVRQAVVNNWGNLFENTCSASGSSGACTQLRHAFRRDDSSGTTDVFVAVLGLPSITFASRITPFCNALLTSDAQPQTGRYAPDYQDEDPIRRTCQGTNNSASSTAPQEQVCSRKGDLGVVLAVPPTSHLPAADAFPTAACASGVFIFATAPRIYPATGTVLCPNGDALLFGNQCIVPADASNHAGCLAGKNSRPSFTVDPSGSVGFDPLLTDGRVYNLHLYKADGSYSVDDRTPARPIQGAMHRIHSTKTMNTPSNVAGCMEQDATSQIGCLVQASPCSIGYAGREASNFAGAAGLKLAALDSTLACIQAGSYPLTRKLYLNTLMGFSNVTGDERALASCFATTATTNAALTTAGFITLPSTVNGGNVYCEDFNEQTLCGAASNTNACAANVAPIPTAGTTCGNSIVEAYEECDNGAANVDTGTGLCSRTCRINF